MHLLDVNVLIAMADPSHEHHAQAQAWFHSEPGRGWATCPLTENAFVRILGNPNYLGVPGGPSVIRLLLQKICSFPGHQFWPDSLTLIDTDALPKLPRSQKLTDIYLLALAVSQKGYLATLDSRIDPSIVPGGAEAYTLIP